MSEPPDNDQDTNSLAEKVKIEVEFSCIALLDDSSPASPEGPLMKNGFSWRSLTVTVKGCNDSFPAASVALTTTI